LASVGQLIDRTKLIRTVEELKVVFSVDRPTVPEEETVEVVWSLPKAGLHNLPEQKKMMKGLA
jgi:hypothetical protein